MNFHDFSQILKEIKNILNKDKPFLPGSFCIKDVIFNGKSLSIIFVKEITHNFNESIYEFPKQSINLNLEVVYEQKLENSIFIELNKFLLECKRRFGYHKEFDELLVVLRENLEFRDVLESI